MAQANVKAKPATRDYLAIVFVLTGSSWAMGPDMDKAVKDARSRAKATWKGYVKWKGKPWVHVYDITDSDGWYATNEGMFDDKTGEKIPLLKTVKD